jgi:hypothetical protein
LYGLVHSFIMGSFINKADQISPGLYVRCLVHYFHTCYVVNNLVDIGNDLHPR